MPGHGLVQPHPRRAVRRSHPATAVRGGADGIQPAMHPIDRNAVRQHRPNGGIQTLRADEAAVHQVMRLNTVARPALFVLRTPARLGQVRLQMAHLTAQCPPVTPLLRRQHGGLPPQAAAHAGGRIARQARQQLEAQTGQPVVTGANYLPPQAPTAMPELPAPKAKSVRTPRKKP